MRRLSNVSPGAGAAHSIKPDEDQAGDQAEDPTTDGERRSLSHSMSSVNLHMYADMLVNDGQVWPCMGPPMRMVTAMVSKPPPPAPNSRSR